MSATKTPPPPDLSARMRTLAAAARRGGFRVVIGSVEAWDGWIGDLRRAGYYGGTVESTEIEDVVAYLEKAIERNVTP